MVSANGPPSGRLVRALSVTLVPTDTWVALASRVTANPLRVGAGTVTGGAGVALAVRGGWGVDSVRPEAESSVGSAGGETAGSSGALESAAGIDSGGDSATTLGSGPPRPMLSRHSSPTVSIEAGSYPRPLNVSWSGIWCNAPSR